MVHLAAAWRVSTQVGPNGDEPHYLMVADSLLTDGDLAVEADFDDDGVVDIGGPDNTIGLWGISLGGIYAGILAGAEPSLDAVSPNAGAAGLADVASRSWQGGVPENIWLGVSAEDIAAQIAEFMEEGLYAQPVQAKGI